MTGPRDWDKELADIDKLMGAPGSAPPPAAPSQNLPAQRGASPAPTAGVVRPAQSAGPTLATRPRDKLAVWLKGGLGVAGAAGLIIWPYDKACGMMLYGYLIGVFAVLYAGVWTMMASWSHRRAWAHALGVVVLLTAVGLAAAEILPRMGYVTPARTWVCPSTP